LRGNRRGPRNIFVSILAHTRLPYDSTQGCGSKGQDEVRDTARLHVVAELPSRARETPHLEIEEEAEMVLTVEMMRLLVRHSRTCLIHI
jgi:hypothetical protein